LDDCAQHNDKQKSELAPFQDPAKKRWVWVGLLILILGMTPFWPITGTIWGLPGWVVFAVFMSFLTSLFIAGVILFVWKDPEHKKGGS